MKKLYSSGSTEDKDEDDGNGDGDEDRDVVRQGCATLWPEGHMWPSKQFFVALKYVGPLAKNAELHSINRLLKFIVCCSCLFSPLDFLQIRYLLKCFKPLNLLVHSTFGNFFHIQYKSNVKKKAKGQKTE